MEHLKNVEHPEEVDIPRDVEHLRQYNTQNIQFPLFK